MHKVDTNKFGKAVRERRTNRRPLPPIRQTNASSEKRDSGRTRVAAFRSQALGKNSFLATARRDATDNGLQRSSLGLCSKALHNFGSFREIAMNRETFRRLNSMPTQANSSAAVARQSAAFKTLNILHMLQAKTSTRPPWHRRLYPV